MNGIFLASTYIFITLNEIRIELENGLHMFIKITAVRV